MNVKELIEQLEKLDPNLMVILHTHDEGYTTATIEKIVEFYNNYYKQRVLLLG
jgi:hypothetical protein